MPLTDIVRGFRHLRVLAIGDAMLDSYLEGSAGRLCTEGPVPVVRKTVEERSPGGAANTAANLRSMGAEVIYLGVVGQDMAAELLRSRLQDLGVDARLVQDDASGTLHKLRILADGQYVVRFDSGERCSAAAQTALIGELDAAFALCDLVVVSDYGYGAVSDGLLNRLEELRATRPCPLIVDSKNLSRFGRVRATVLTPNHLEAQLALTADAQPGPLDGDRVRDLGRRLLERLPAEWIAVTMAGDGVMLVGRDGSSAHVPAHPVANANDVGAGDSFTAALALSLGSGASPVEAVTVGVAAAGIAVRQRLTATVQQQELLQRVSLQDRPLPPSVASVLESIRQAREDGKTIVFTNGVFDILHAGHVHFLRRARSLGDVLVVGVNSDAGTRRLKGANRPINSERDRQALVAALDPVDHVVLFDEDTPAELIRTLQPHIHVKGGDYADVALPEAEAVSEVGGRIEILPLVGGLSTSSMIDRILTLAGAQQ